MCCTIYLSTTSQLDLSTLASSNLTLTRVSEADDMNMLALLSHMNQWHLSGKHGGCSCHFRHTLQNWTNAEIIDIPIFQPPQDWCLEDQEDVESTKAAYDLFSVLLGQGDQIDLIDYWNGTEPDEMENLLVKLCDVPRDHFRFFEDYKFTFSA